jgi:hypothetical protein
MAQKPKRGLETMMQAPAIFDLRERLSGQDQQVSISDLLDIEEQETDDGDGEFSLMGVSEPTTNGDFPPMDQWGTCCVSGQLPYFPSVVLAGFGNAAASDLTFEDICKWKGRLLVIENATPNHDDCDSVLKPFLFDSMSEGGEIFRGWLRRMQRHWRKFMLVCTTATWTERIVAQIGHTKDVVRNSLADGVDQEPSLPDPRWVVEQVDEAVLARAVKRWYDAANQMAGKGGLTVPQDEEDEKQADSTSAPVVKATLVDFYHEWMKSLYLLPVSNNSLMSLDAQNRDEEDPDSAGGASMSQKKPTGCSCQSQEAGTFTARVAGP